VTTLLLVAHALNPSLRHAVFGGTAGLDPAGADAAAGRVQRADVVFAGPAPACIQTAEAFGLTPTVDRDLADVDYGSWTGRTLADVSADRPDDVRAWLTDPAAAPHGGESLDELVRRVAGWLDRVEGTERRTVLAVTHAAVVRAAVVHALGAPPGAFWRVDAGPLSVTRLRSGDRGWSLALTVT
jgi:broad specificity phosphatase PhoE